MCFVPDFGLRTWGYRIRGARWAISDFGLSDFGLECFRFSYKPLPDFGLWDFGLWDFRLCPDLGFRTMDLGLGLAGPPTWPMVPLPDLGTQPWISDWAKRLGARFRTVDFGLGPSLVPRSTSREIATTTFQGNQEIVISAAETKPAHMRLRIL